MRHGRGWLFWLALLLPMAQSGALWHGFSHAVVDAGSQNRDPSGLHAAHCDLCLSAAAVIGGALPGAPQAWTPLAAQHQLRWVAVDSVWLVVTTTGYLSRAPPFVPL